MQRALAAVLALAGLRRRSGSPLADFSFDYQDLLFEPAGEP
jgi:hypothetical protein